MNAAAPFEPEPTSNGRRRDGNLGGGLIRRRSHLDLSDPLEPAAWVELLMATLYSLDG